ncbi:hypothetical protein MES5069_520144 [Mesorhizobium escarrei]|uniref:Uncharacterized protein n=1 Tax=Mesorhizobium escarrei TaxID=666018 RepID=A0ABM9ECG3_9HYPH|nr:hypothetical protein MES5069_520144 [Mesorhizobium escarrei]
MAGPARVAWAPTSGTILRRCGRGASGCAPVQLTMHLLRSRRANWANFCRSDSVNLIGESNKNSACFNMVSYRVRFSLQRSSDFNLPTNKESCG